jgi:hypothetical protein
MQTNEAFFVTPQYIFDNYSLYLDDNIDENSINSAILLAQDKFTQSALGFTLYRKYINDISAFYNGGAPLGTHYQMLFENWIQKEVSLWALWIAYPSLHIKATNKSIVTKHSDNSNAVTLKEVDYMRNDIQSSAMFYDSRIREEILNYPQNFPEYFTITGVDRIIPKSLVYRGSIYLNPTLRKSNGYGSKGCPGCPNDGIGTNLNW